MEADPAINSTCPGCVERDRRIARLEARVAGLEATIEQLRRGGKRQAAPFSKGPPKADPKKPGRKGGDEYGTKARRPLPPRIDEVHEAKLPCACPGCGGGDIEHEHTARQYQAEIPRKVIYRQFNVQVGHCRTCGRPLQGRHELQTSDAELYGRAAPNCAWATCIRRCHELLEVATRGAVIFPRQVKAVLNEALAARDDRDAGKLSARRAAAVADELDARMHKLLRLTKTHPPNERFAKHLWKNRDHLFTFLRHHNVDATNWRAEQAIRPAVVNRKVWGGNRADAGAQAQSVLTSVLQTAKLRAIDSMQFLSRLLRAPAAQQPLLIPG